MSATQSSGIFSMAPRLAMGTQREYDEAVESENPSDDFSLVTDQPEGGGDHVALPENEEEDM